ncbi:MAG: helix-turn-helix domain-containing protein [Herbinix sp.]|nr:helix-turn-helix domain-containing protein [Herbinix sp.]
MYDYRNEIRRLMIAVNQVEGLYYSAAKKLGVKENTLTLLYALDDGKSHSQKQICVEWFIPRTTINTIVKECVDAGYIKLVSEEHSKEKKVAITDKGKIYAQTVLQAIYHAEQNAMTATLTKFTPDFVEVMEQFVAHLQKEIEQQIINQLEKPRKAEI